MCALRIYINQNFITLHGNYENRYEKLLIIKSKANLSPLKFKKTLLCHPIMGKDSLAYILEQIIAIDSFNMNFAKSRAQWYCLIFVQRELKFKSNHWSIKNRRKKKTWILQKKEKEKKRKKPNSFNMNITHVKVLKRMITLGIFRFIVRSWFGGAPSLVLVFYPQSYILWHDKKGVVDIL